MDYEADRRFGAHLRDLRKRQQLSLAGVDLTRSALAKLEAGQRHFYLEEILALQTVLGISFDELLDI